MPTAAPESPPRKKRHMWRWLGIALLLFLASFCWQLFGPNPPIIVSRETTYITEPLGPDGLPDYEQYMLDKYREGVTPENNAAVLVWQAIWPGNLKPDQYAAFAEELGMEEIPSGNNSLKSLRDEEYRKRVSKWLAGKYKDSENLREEQFDPESEMVEGIVHDVMSHPWTSKQVPPLAQWVRENQEAMDLVVDATRRICYYSPSPLLLDNDPTAVVHTNGADIPSLRDLSRSLTARAMWNMGEGRFEEAWSDLLAAHRLARLISRRQSMTEQLVAMSMVSIANHATLVMLDRSELDINLADKVQADLSELDDMNSMAQVIDQDERMAWLDAALHAKLEGPQFLESWMQFDASDLDSNWESIDWNVALKGINYWFNRLTAAADAPRWTDRHAAFRRIDDELKEWKRSTNERIEADGESVNSEWRGQQMANLFASVIAPAYQGASEAQDRTNTQLTLTRLAAALAVYRAEHGEYPEKLDALVPSVLARLPVDLFHEKPFVYQRDDVGYLLYSAGVNGENDKGSNRMPSIIAGRDVSELDPDGDQMMWEKIPLGADDIAIRVPTPPFKLPEPAQQE